MPFLAALPLAIQGFATLAPIVKGLLKKNSTAETVVDVVGMLSSTARSITGAGTDDEALEVLKSDPAKLAEYKMAVNDHTAKMYEKETERIEVVSKTYRAELASKDSYVRRMRPTFGYALIYCMIVMFTSVAATAMIAGVDKAVNLIEAYAKMKWIFVSAFGAISVYINNRTKEKLGGLGQLGALGRLGKKFFK